jgi:PAS domain S-box-containing protein
MKKILVVDDEATITTHLEERLKIMKYEVVGRAPSGELAVEMAKRLRPDLILMDIVMRGKLDGIDAAKIIKAELDIPVVFLTAYGDDKFISRAKNVEPLGYIIKPFQDSALKAAIEVALYNKDISRQLQDSEEYWRFLAENIDAGIILGDCTGKIFFWNKGAENIFLYGASEAIGKSLTFIMPEIYREEYRKGIEQFLLTERPEVIPRKAEIVGLRKNWSKFPLGFSLTPSEVKGKIFFIGIARDLTEQKRAEDGMKASLREKERILQEIQRQVQNNLQAIYSLIGLQFELLKEKQVLNMLKESRKRIQSIALMAEKLNQAKGLGKIDFANYIRNLAGRLFQSYEVDPDQVHLELDVENAFLDVKTAITCGMIASELISNSLKYAFPGGRKGGVNIDFHQEQERKYRLSVRDNGVGLPKDIDFRKPKSMGLQVVNDLVSQLEGEIKLDRRGGTRFQVWFEER